MKKKIIIYVFIILLSLLLFYNIVIKNIVKNNVEVEPNIINLENGIHVIEFGTHEEESFDSNKREKIIEYNFGSVYFYDVKNIEFNYMDNILNLKESLITNNISIEQVISQAEDDSNKQKNDKGIFKDGGSIKYRYPTFSIIKFNSLDGNKDIYIGKPEMSISVLKKGY